MGPATPKATKLKQPIPPRRAKTCAVTSPNASSSPLWTSPSGTKTDVKCITPRWPVALAPMDFKSMTLQKRQEVKLT